MNRTRHLRVSTGSAPAAVVPLRGSDLSLDIVIDRLDVLVLGLLVLVIISLLLLD